MHNFGHGDGGRRRRRRRRGGGGGGGPHGWLDSQKQLLEKDYVIFKFDDVRDLNGIELARSLELNAYGVPCHTILDADGLTLINSIAPFGNVGSPSGQGGSKHLRKMLNNTRQRLSDQEVNSIVISVPLE